MLDKIGKGLLVIVLTCCVVLGGYLAYSRHFVELQDRTVELCVDLNDMRKVAAFEKKALGPVLDEGVLDVCKPIGVPYSPGTFTPTEASNARKMGCEIIKIFPAGVVGPAYVEAVLKPMKGINFMPTTISLACPLKWKSRSPSKDFL